MNPNMQNCLAVRKSFVDNSTKTFWTKKSNLKNEINLVGVWKPIYFKKT